MPTYRRPVEGTLVLAVIPLGLDLRSMSAGNLIGPLVLIAIGVSVLLGSLSRYRWPGGKLRRPSQRPGGLRPL